MPVLKQLECSIELEPGDLKLPEYGTIIKDGYAETFVAVPDTTVPFSVHVKSQGYIAPGLAIFVFMDGIYQSNRNRIGLKLPGPTVPPNDYEVDFRLRQREDRTTDGRFVAREWTFAKLDRIKAAKAHHIRNKDFSRNVGTIEIVVLRCHSTVTEPTRLLPKHALRIHDAPPTQDKPVKESENKATPAVKQASSVREPVSEFGGLFGLFDGSNDDTNLDQPDDQHWKDQHHDEQTGVIHGVVWDPKVGKYKQVSSCTSQAPVITRAQDPTEWRTQETDSRQLDGSEIPLQSDTQDVTAPNQSGAEEDQHHNTRHKVVFIIGPDEDEDTDQEEEQMQRAILDPVELIQRLRDLLTGNFLYNFTPKGLALFEEELNRYKGAIRRLQKYDPHGYNAMESELPSVGELEARFARDRAALDLEAVSDSEDDGKQSIDIPVFFDGAGDDQQRRHGQHRQPIQPQHLPNAVGWQPVGHGNVNFDQHPQYQPFIRRTAPYNNDLVQLYAQPNNARFGQGIYAQPYNAQSLQVFGQPEYAMPQQAQAFPGMVTSWHPIGKHKKPVVQFRSDVEPSDPNNVQATAQGYNSAETRRTDPKFKQACEENVGKQKRTAKADVEDLNERRNRGLDALNAKMDKENVRSKSDGKKTSSSHHFGNVDGDANQDGGWKAAAAAGTNWQHGGEKNSPWGIDAKNDAAWGDASKKSGKSGGWAKSNAKSKTRHDPAQKTAALAGWDDIAAPQQQWNVTADQGDGWGNTAAPDNGWNDFDQSDKNEPWPASQSGSKSGSRSSKTTSRSTEQKSNSNVHGWDTTNSINGQDAAGWGNNSGWSQGSSNNADAGWDKTSQRKNKTTSNAGWTNPPGQDAENHRAEEQIDPKAHIKPYWQDWNKALADGDSAAARNQAKPRSAYKYPALAPPVVPAQEAKDKSHGVQAGKGADYLHKCRRPEYIDTMEQPYAVFTFKYRSREAVEKLLKIQVDEVDYKKLEVQVAQQKLMQQPKNQLAAELARLRMGKDRRSPAGASTESWGANDGGWGNASTKSTNKRGGWDNTGQGAWAADHGWG